MKYGSKGSTNKKVMANLVKFCQNLTLSKVTGVKVKVTGVMFRYQMKGLVTGYLHVKYENNRSTRKKVMANLVIFCPNLTLSKVTGVKVKVTGVKAWYQMKALVTRFLHVKYERNWAINKKVMANVKVVLRQTNRQTNKQTNRQTDRAKTICPPITDLGGIKKLN